MKDQHPVSWLMRSLKPELYEPLHMWMDDVLGTPILKPRDVIMPDTFRVQHMFCCFLGDAPSISIQHLKRFDGVPGCPNPITQGIDSSLQLCASPGRLQSEDPG